RSHSGKTRIRKRTSRWWGRAIIIRGSFTVGGSRSVDCAQLTRFVRRFNSRPTAVPPPRGSAGPVVTGGGEDEFPRPGPPPAGRIPSAETWNVEGKPVLGAEVEYRITEEIGRASCRERAGLSGVAVGLREISAACRVNIC